MSITNTTPSREELQAEGRQAYLNGEDDDSPYLKGSDEADFWHEGYDEAKQEDQAPECWSV